MAQLARSVATLRIIGDHLVPDEVSTLLGSSPTHAQRKGDQIPIRGGERVARFGMWRLAATDTEPEDVNSQVTEILEKLTSDLASWRSVAGQFQVNLFCGWFMQEGNEGLSISPANLVALGERGIELDLDIYAPSADA
jgi:Domain of unknown function (DUF4279)